MLMNHPHQKRLQAAPKVYRLVLNNVAAASGPSNNATFNVDLAGVGLVDLPLSGPFLMCVESFNAKGTSANASLASRVYHMRMTTASQARNVFETRADGSCPASTIVATVRGFSYQFPSPTTDAMGMPVNCMDFVNSKQIPVSFTYCEPGLNGSLVTELDAAQPGNADASWSATLLIWEA